MKGAEQEKFVLSAMDESHERLLKLSRDYPVGLLNSLPIQLSEQGIKSREVIAYEKSGEQEILFLRDGREVRIITSIQVSSKL